MYIVLLCYITLFYNVLELFDKILSMNTTVLFCFVSYLITPEQGQAEIIPIRTAALKSGDVSDSASWEYTASTGEGWGQMQQKERVTDVRGESDEEDCHWENSIWMGLCLSEQKCVFCWDQVLRETADTFISE